jgi:hypothetical protein
LKDVERIENFVKTPSKFIIDPNYAGKIIKGFAIILTNDNLCWNNNDKKTADYQFHIYTGKSVSGNLCYFPKTPNAKNVLTKRHLEHGAGSHCVELKGEYTCDWQDCEIVIPSATVNKQFRFLVFEITK